MCVPEEGVGTAKNVPDFELGSVFEVMKNKNLIFMETKVNKN